MTVPGRVAGLAATMLLMGFIDLSHAIEDGMVTYPGLPGPRVSDHLSRDEAEARYAPGVRFQIGAIEMVANTGTYLDTPFHRFDEGADLAALPLESVADLRGVLVDTGSGTTGGIDPAPFDRDDLAGAAVIVRTGWSRHWRTPAYGSGHPFLAGDAVQALVAAAPALVGIDSLNIDDANDPQRPAHTRLLGAGISIVEHLCDLDRLEAGVPFRFSAAPVKVAGMGSFPVRAFARV